jgi:hypothetical protein
MSLLGDNTIPLRVPVPKKVRLENTTRRIKELSKNCFSDLVRTQREGIDLMWDHENLTPQEIIDELGVDVFKIFHFHAKLTQFISELAQFDGSTVELKYPTNSFDMDVNTGTVTVTDQPYQP